MDMREMFEITRLLQKGGLTEATSMIQRALHGVDRSTFQTGDATAQTDSTIIEGSFRVVDEHEESASSSTQTRQKYTANLQNPFEHLRTSRGLDWQEYFE